MFFPTPQDSLVLDDMARHIERDEAKNWIKRWFELWLIRNEVLYRKYLKY
jgi:hypothetical protein